MGKLAGMMPIPFRRRRNAFAGEPDGGGFFASGLCNTCHTFGIPALLAAMLAACSGEADSADSKQPKVECALAGAASFAPDCKMELHEGKDGRTAILHHPDGGFRRFQLGVPGEGLITADGMEQAEVVSGEGMVEVRVGADRYRLPIKP